MFLRKKNIEVEFDPFSNIHKQVSLHIFLHHMRLENKLAINNNIGNFLQPLASMTTYVKYKQQYKKMTIYSFLHKCMLETVRNPAFTRCSGSAIPERGLLTSIKQGRRHRFWTGGAACVRKGPLAEGALF